VVDRDMARYVIEDRRDAPIRELLRADASPPGPPNRSSTT
jgi:hypothetical protein